MIRDRAEHGRRVSAGLRHRYADPAERERESERMRAVWADPVKRAAMLAARAKAREQHGAAWQEAQRAMMARPEVREAMREARRTQLGGRMCPPEFRNHYRKLRRAGLSRELALDEIEKLGGKT